MSQIDESLFSTDFKAEPYWWIAAPRPTGEPDALPAQADAVVVGSGITGLNAARELARAGRSVHVIDAGDLGIGGSSRNAGNIGRVLKHEFSTILKRDGEQTALDYYREMQSAYDAVADVVSGENISCYYETPGRLILAYTEKQLRLIETECALKKHHLGEQYELLDRSSTEKEVGSRAFVGAAFIPDSAALHPGLYHLGLLDAARRQGVTFAGNTLVTGIENFSSKGSRRFTVLTDRGTVEARDVVVATNGYSKGGVPSWLRRRLVPFDAYMIAIEVPDENRLNAILKNKKVCIDANHNLFFFRRAADGRHVLFGGHTGSRQPQDLRVMGQRLYADACRLLPGLKGFKIARAWTGRCAGTFDLYPHIGLHDGVHYAAGYCFAGVPMGTYLGRKIAAGITGQSDADTVFRRRAMPTVPLYNGSPWFIPYFMKYYDWLDARDGGRPQ